ncbi:hypothetical protein AAY473_030491 [Plecturocebus cupreus]
MSHHAPQRWFSVNDSALSLYSSSHDRKTDKWFSYKAGIVKGQECMRHVGDVGEKMTLKGEDFTPQTSQRRRLVQEALFVLIVRVHHGLVVLEQSNPHVAPLAVNVVCKVVDTRDLTGEDACLRAVVLPAVIKQFVKLHWGPHRWERCG